MYAFDFIKIYFFLELHFLNVDYFNNFKRLSTYGFHPRSWGLMYNIPALDTVAGVAVLKLEISNSSLIAGVKAIRSLLANVNT